ncbi:hypothetical protein WDW86_08530 [Bdellovibrionota bacterium FG-2]
MAVRAHAVWQEFLSLGFSAIAQDGTCDASKYADLLAKLGEWKTGSAIYFYELNGND